MQEKRLFKLGSVSLIIAGVLVALTIPLIPLIIPSLAPSSARAGLVSLQSQGVIYATTWVFYLVSDLLFGVAFFALYQATKQQGVGIAKIAVGLNTVFVALDVGLDIPLRLWLIALSSSYAATSSSQTVSSADFAITLSNQVALFATLFQFVALILASFLLRKNSSFGNRPAYFGYATGIVALLFIPTFIAGSMLSGLFNIVGFALLVVWSILVGTKLRKLSR